MNISATARVACLAVCCLACAASHAQTSPPSRPNIIFVLVDDMGYCELGCYGNTAVKTPNIDRLAREGVRFERFYVNSPICSPSRVAFTTGQHPTRWRITSFIEDRASNEKRGMAQWLPTEAPSLARMLQQAGYRTAHVGKWHMGGGRDVGGAPLITEYGFDASLTQFEGLGDRILPTFDTMFPRQERRAMPLGLASAKLGRGNVEFVKRHEVSGRYVKRALEFIRSAREANQPFYLNLWPDDVHTPLEPSPVARGDGSLMDMYRGVVQELDRDLGVLFDAIRDDPQLRLNTIIVFASDNGHDPVIQPASTVRGHKATLYEGGIRTPLIVWSPGDPESAARAGMVNRDTVVAGFDLPPTVLRLAAVPVPADVKFDGQDMSSAFRGQQPEREGELCWLRPPDRPGPQGAFPDLAIRQGPWKLLIEEDGTNPQLFDVMADPDEQRNLAAEHPQRVKQLKMQLVAWRKQMPQPTTAPLTTNSR